MMVHVFCLLLFCFFGSTLAIFNVNTKVFPICTNVSYVQGLLCTFLGFILLSMIAGNPDFAETLYNCVDNIPDILQPPR